MYSSEAIGTDRTSRSSQRQRVVRRKADLGDAHAKDVPPFAKDPCKKALAEINIIIDKCQQTVADRGETTHGYSLEDAKQASATAASASALFGKILESAKSAKK